MSKNYQSNRYYTPRATKTSREVAKKHTYLKTVKRIAVRITVGVAILVTASWGITYGIAQASEKQRIEQENKITVGLEAAINPIITDNSNSTIGIAIQDTKTGTTRTFGSTNAFEAASTAKVIAALAYLHASEQGKVSLNDDLGTYDAEFQLKQMITQSNNESWELLVQAIGRPYLQQYAKDIGSDYTVGKNTITPASMASVLSQLERGSLLNKSNTALLLSYMQDTNDEDLIPAGVIDGVEVHHKYGLLNGNLHDVAILKKNDRTYTVAIYTKNNDDSDDNARSVMIRELANGISTKLFAAK